MFLPEVAIVIQDLLKTQETRKKHESFLATGPQFVRFDRLKHFITISGDCEVFLHFTVNDT